MVVCTSNQGCMQGRIFFLRVKVWNLETISVEWIILYLFMLRQDKKAGKMQING